MQIIPRYYKKDNNIMVITARPKVLHAIRLLISQKHTRVSPRKNLVQKSDAISSRLLSPFLLSDFLLQPAALYRSHLHRL